MELGGNMLRTVTIRIPEELHKEFKIKMVLDNVTMQDRIIELIREEVEKAKANGTLKSI